MILRIFIFLILTLFAHAVPPLLNHQGRIAVDGINFDGPGQFKFALVNSTGTETFWSNDSTSTAGSEPATAATLPVTMGIYSAILGGTGMDPLTPAALQGDDVWLRVWFNDGILGSQQITPDHRLVASPYALVASRVELSLLSDLAVAPAKPVLGWGENTQGQLNIPTLSEVAQVAASDSSSLALLKNGTLVQWGGSITPPTLTGITRIAAGPTHFLALKPDRTVTSWGTGPPVPGDLGNVSELAAGQNHSLALLTSNTVRAWGQNTFQQLDVPTGLANVTAIACGNDHCLALKSDGTVVAWGRNQVGQSTVPAGLTNVTAIAAGAFHSLALKSDGAVVAWGWDNAGQSDVPSDVVGVTAITGGYTFSAAVLSDGSVKAWGDNTQKQVTIPSNTTFVRTLAAGANHILALRDDLIPAQVVQLNQENIFTEKIGIGRAPTTNALEVEGTASKTTAGNWFANSDRRIKTEITPVTGALEKLAGINLVEFNYTASYLAAHPNIQDKRYLNVIAQEFASVFPQEVQSSGETLPDGSTILQVDTYPLTIYSAAAVQELHRENEALKKRLAAQEVRLLRLEKLLAK